MSELKLTVNGEEHLVDAPVGTSLAQVLREELIARLSVLSEIDLISRWTSMQLKDRKKDIRAIGNELGARYVVGGSVRRFQDSVRITVQLISADSDHHSASGGHYIRGWNDHCVCGNRH